MISDVDEAIRQLLIADVPLPVGEVDISFERPTREWSSRLSRPTLNLFLFDVRERLEFRDTNDIRSLTADGRMMSRRPPRRIDLSYVITAWAKEPADEHRVLSRVLASMFRTLEMTNGSLGGELDGSDYPVLLRIMPPDYLAKPADLWGVLDNDLHASLTWVATAPLHPVAPFVGPIVRTRELRVGNAASDERESFFEIAGVVWRDGDPAATVPGVRVSVVGTAVQTTTEADGVFRLQPLSAGTYVLRADMPAGEAHDRPITIPSSTYDISI